MLLNQICINIFTLNLGTRKKTEIHKMETLFLSKMCPDVAFYVKVKSKIKTNDSQSSFTTFS